MGLTRRPDGRSPRERRDSHMSPPPPKVKVTPPESNNHDHPRNPNETPLGVRRRSTYIHRSGY
jgi:hypothetical protein